MKQHTSIADTDYFNRLKKSYNSKEDIDSLNSFKEYIESGKESFRHKVALWDEETMVEYDINTIFKFVKGYYLAANTIKYAKERNYSYFLNGYYYLVLFQISHLKKDQFAPAVSGADLSLIYILSLTYFPEEADLTGQQLVRFLKHHLKEEEHNNRYEGSMHEMFGYPDVVWLASIVSQHYHKEAIATQIKSYCAEQINPSYHKAIENLLSEDETVVNDWVNELVDFHVKNSKSDLTRPFNHEEWQYFPVEIIALLELRVRKGLEISFIQNEFLHQFIPHLGISIPVTLDEFTLKLKARVLAG